MHPWSPTHGARQARTRRLRGPSVAVREKTDGAHRPSWRTDAVRYTSVAPATQRSTARQGDTPRDSEKTARLAENSQLPGRFRGGWQVLGSNQRRLSRRFYRPLPLTTRATRHVPENLGQDTLPRMGQGARSRVCPASSVLVRFFPSPIRACDPPGRWRSPPPFVSPSNMSGSAALQRATLLNALTACRRSQRRGGAAANCLMLAGVTTVEQVPEPALPVLPPEEALRRARPLPRRAQLVVEGVSPAEWDEFQQALTEA
jgi:hypothetical protein